MEFTDLKAPDPLQGIPPWQDPQWVADADGWIDAECARAGLARTGPALARGRPWSVVARVPTRSGTVWFKASPPISSFEPALLAALAAWHPEAFTAPVAVDLDRAWSLTRDGGPRPHLGPPVPLLPRPPEPHRARGPRPGRDAQPRPARPQLTRLRVASAFVDGLVLSAYADIRGDQC